MVKNFIFAFSALLVPLFSFGAPVDINGLKVKVSIIFSYDGMVVKDSNSPSGYALTITQGLSKNEPLALPVAHVDAIRALISLKGRTWAFINTDQLRNLPEFTGNDLPVNYGSFSEHSKLEFRVTRGSNGNHIRVFSGVFEITHDEKGQSVGGGESKRIDLVRTFRDGNSYRLFHPSTPDEGKGEFLASLPNDIFEYLGAKWAICRDLIERLGE